ncbi:uncharacterized protein BP01DRAFT_391286 [Aspergillus saccharolyticus JOP 1030-1]|uniref:Uncharacterized protein n=1 Tax=Aspergillus saccharolyticus JOP 1030-1 TaxID=1450539 RepID=A0A318ZEF8_9EURO|nr:hypothetical protein BP01DRAFT_391286 [Aspergillus saccharolyticus JOP 1030-1]PYH45926.1 hypothetical protein BP01DRAFT_391286 [Aspergillus saccharolyticus JOP 1030-1]
MEETHQKRSYLVYAKGQTPESLQLGSLCIDPPNPVNDVRKIYQFPVEELLPWTSTHCAETTCALNLTVSHEWLEGAGRPDLVSHVAGKENDIEVRLEGPHGRQVQIQRPEAFLEQIVLQSGEVKRWLATHLTVSRTMHYLSRTILETDRHPHIWLVTGLQYITNASMKAGWSSSSRALTGIPGPILHPAVAALTGLVDASDKEPPIVYESEGSTSDATKEKIWAAQFMRLKLKFRPCDSSKVKLPDEIQLYRFVQLGGMGFEGHEHVPSQEFAQIEGLVAEDGDVEQSEDGTFLGMECEDQILYEELLDQVESRKAK